MVNELEIEEMAKRVLLRDTPGAVMALILNSQGICGLNIFAAK